MGSWMYSNLEYDKGGILSHKGGKEGLGGEWGWDLAFKKLKLVLAWHHW